ncbi:peptidoglycan-binding domain-containing protein [Paracoccus sp. 11-3]|uniref:Peptidoglycan-binding domain-containing protein n=1 Tax=Paracoccus amoyensis TaxID=2760093 RepID=A0A926J5Y9_9RHOB|nr:peptidoglycan-binding domain-containing protein [Paracoccus amoyensis]MBC9246727.1 peptidoglycan-binding domain-containing protein [Paracoccus amoyensis]
MDYVFKKPARKVTRVFLHCSASDRPEHDSAAVIDAWHKANGWAGIGYHFFIRKDGTLEIGRDLEKTPAAQGGHNTATIAICLHGLEIDKFTEAQFVTLRTLCGQIDDAYGGTVTFHGHREVSARACPVFIYRDVLKLDGEGYLRQPSVSEGTVPLTGRDFGTLEVLLSSAAVLKLGSKGDLVRDLQAALKRLGYFPGKIDGDFGPLTEVAVLAFQAANHLETDGKFGSLSREALAAARPRQLPLGRSFASLGDLATAGSRIAKASRNNIAVGAILSGGGLATMIDDVTGQADIIQRLFEQHGLAAGAVILAAGAFVAWQSWKAGQARVQDHQSGKTL